MKHVEYSNWMLLSERTGRRRRSTWKMTREQARELDPGATPVPGTAEFRELPENERDRLLLEMHPPRRS